MYNSSIAYTLNSGELVNYISNIINSQECPNNKDLIEIIVLLYNRLELAVTDLDDKEILEDKLDKISAIVYDV